MRIGVAQMHTRAGDLARTCERIVEYARQAGARGVELLVCPLTTLTGPLPVERTEQEGFLLDLSAAVEELAGRVACPCLIPVVWDFEGDPSPEALLLRDGEVVPLKFMTYLRGLVEGLRGESDASPATGRGSGETGEASWDYLASLPVVTVGDVRLGVAFTYDDLDDFVDYDHGVDAVVYVSGYGYALDDPSSALGAALSENRYARDAEDMDVWVVGVGSLGGYGMQVFCGSSFVCTPWGEISATAPAFEEHLLVADIDPTAEGPLERPLTPEVYNRPFHLWQALVLGLRDCLTADGGISDAVLELDGGLASLLLAVLATDALGPTHVHALVSPAVTGDALRWCREVARGLRIDVAELGMPDVLPRGLAAAQADDPLVGDLMQTHLARLARSLDGTVIGCADKTGLALEATRNSSLAVALMPFGDVYRSDLIEVAHMRNALSPLIPLEAELAYRVPDLPALDARSSREDRLRRVDLVLSSHLEWERSLSEIVDHGTSRALVEQVMDRLYETQRARTGRAPYLMVSSRTLYDARRPLGHAWRDRYRDASERSYDEELMRRLEEAGERLVSQGEDEATGQGGEAGDILGYLRDFVQGMGQDAPSPRPGGPEAGGGWSNPFSEN